jgi:hypothetical protein
LFALQGTLWVPPDTFLIYDGDLFPACVPASALNAHLKSKQFEFLRRN